MKKQLPLSLSLLAAFALAACDNRTPSSAADSTPIPEPIAKTKTLETRRLGNAIDAYEQSPTPDHALAVKKALADLDGEIAELEARVAKTSGGARDEAELKRKNLDEYRETQSTRFKILEAKSGAASAREPATDARSVEQKAEDKAKDIGDRVEAGAKKTGEALEEAGRKAKDAFKDLGR